MKQSHVLLKLAAVASSLLLVAGYVLFSAGTFRGRTAPTSDGGEAAPESADPRQPALGPKQPEPTSVSGTNPFPTPEELQASWGRLPARTIMGGSKSRELTHGLPPRYAKVIQEYFRRQEKDASRGGAPDSRPPTTSQPPPRPR